MRVYFLTYRSSWESWDTLFNKAAEFATSVGPEFLIGISHSADKGEGVVTVWYWGEEQPPAEEEEKAPPEEPDPYA